ncbi:high affinity copper uptake protein 1 [Lucilia sericata]|uniref:high affinity copper uptake protein 1 n=1 Tax=Lucilia sericata TaxID=13632 RepID=UPI0018A8023C|nr:high affinity copper uptake protein 1 [Lucilia sericata]
MDHDHDHGGMGGGGDMGGGKMCPMIMTFHAGHCERILWNGWVASTVTEFVFSALAIFLVSFLYEGLKFVREYFLRQTVKKEAERVAAELQQKNGGAGTSNGQPACHGNMPEIRQKSYKEKIFAKPHLIQTLINLVQIILSYLLMLIFMTFNYWLCLAVVLGLGLGYFFFGWIKQDVYESECCH